MIKVEKITGSFMGHVDYIWESALFMSVIWYCYLCFFSFYCVGRCGAGNCGQLRRGLWSSADDPPSDDWQCDAGRNGTHAGGGDVFGGNCSKVCFEPDGLSVWNQCGSRTSEWTEFSPGAFGRDVVGCGGRFDAFGCNGSIFDQGGARVETLW